MRLLVVLFFASSIFIYAQNPPSQTTSTTTTHHPRWKKKPASSEGSGPAGTVFDPNSPDNSCSPTDNFQLLCALPYTGRPRQIDQSCGHCGNAEQSSMSAQEVLAEEWQNFQKNNLCAEQPQPPTLIATADLKELQVLVDAIPGFKYGNPHGSSSGPPPDRSKLRDLPALSSGKTLHEGDLVTFVGYLVEEHYSPPSASSAGESVNCVFSDHPNVDIHIALSDTKVPFDPKASAAVRDPILCQTASAEMIPHSRPETWEVTDLESVSDRQVKVTGQLFFDGSHHPCGPKHGKSDPSRIASWEIHPIYEFQVCKTSSSPCKDSDWETIDQALQESKSPVEEP